MQNTRAAAHPPLPLPPLAEHSEAAVGALVKKALVLACPFLPRGSACFCHSSGQPGKCYKIHLGQFFLLPGKLVTRARLFFPVARAQRNAAIGQADGRRRSTVLFDGHIHVTFFGFPAETALLWPSKLEFGISNTPKKKSQKSVYR